MDRDFLFGVIAVQLGQATPQQVMAAASAYFADRSKSIPERLLAEGAIAEDRFKMIEDVVVTMVEAHGGDVKQTVETLGGDSAVYASFGGSLVVDEQGEVSLAPEVERKDDSFDETSNVFPEHPGRYRIEADGEIGRGGIGRVLVAFDEGLGREIAVKELLAEVSSSAVSTPKTDRISRTGAIAARFLREARVTGQLEHPNIVPVYEVGQRQDGAYYYTMKLVRGRTLADALKECRALPDRLKLLHHYVDLCNAIAYAHSRGVIHRDIKTDNVMLGEFGETVVVDWGLAKVAGKQDIRGGEIARELEMLQDAGTGQTVDGSAIGTPAYMSPEQADGQVEEIDERSDIWSLGAVLYEVLCGKPPFEGFTPYEIIGRVLKDDVVPPRARSEEIPAELSAVAMKALTRDKPKRYQKAGDLADEINAFMSGGRIAAYQYSSWELLKGFVAKNKAASALIGLVIVLLIVGGIVLYGAYREAGEARDRAESEKTRAQHNEQDSQLNLAAALQEKAERLFEDRRILSSRVYSAAALVRHPCYSLGLTSADECNARFPGGAMLRTRALSTLFQTQFEIIARPEWVHRGDAAYQWLGAADGDRFVTRDVDGLVELWDSRTHERVAEMEERVERAGQLTSQWTVALAPGGTTVATGDDARTVSLWDDSGKRIGTLEHREGDTVYGVAISPRDELLAVSTQEGVKLWDYETRTLVSEFGDKGLRGAVFAPDGKAVADLDWEGGRVVLFDVENPHRKRCVHEIERPIGGGFSPDGTVIAIVSDHRAVTVLDAATCTPVRTIPLPEESVTGIDYSTDGTLLAAGAGDGEILFFDAHTYEQVYALERHGGPVSDVRFISGDRLVTTGFDGTWRLWRVEHGRGLSKLDGHSTWIGGLGFSPDGKLLVSAGYDGTVRIWDVSGARLESTLTEGAIRYTSASFSPDGSRILTTGGLATREAPPSITIWDTATRKPIRAWSASDVDATWGRFSPDGRFVAVSHHEENMASVWDADTGALVCEVESKIEWWGKAIFSPDGKLFVTPGDDNAICLRDVKTGQPVITLEGLPDVPMSFAFLAGGSQLLSGGFEGSVVLWDVASRRKLRVFGGQGTWVSSFAVVPGEQMFLTAGDNPDVGIWSIDATEPLLALELSSGSNGVTIAPDGKSFAVIDGTKIVIYPLDLSLLDADPEQLLAQAEQEARMKLDGFSLVPLEQ